MNEDNVKAVCAVILDLHARGWIDIAVRMRKELWDHIDTMDDPEPLWALMNKILTEIPHQIFIGFQGRKLGADGICYPMKETVPYGSHDSIREYLSERFEHVFGIYFLERVAK